MLDIGLEIKILREKQKISSKDLAQRIGLSQSQMSRLEKGQRRIDIRTLHNISDALGVAPSFFFRTLAGESGPPLSAEQAATAPLFAPPIPYDHLGKLVRSERHRRHLTVDELATKVGRTRAFMGALENGKHALDAELADKICRALKLSPSFFIEAQAKWISALESQVARLNQALAEVSRGATSEDANAADSSTTGAIPMFGSLESTTPPVFDADGRPVGEPEDFVRVPGLAGDTTFAFRVVGEAMISSSPPSFEENDIVIFGTSGVPENGNLALVRLRDDRLLFRQIFFDGDTTVRLQPLNVQRAPESHPRKDVIGISVLAGHVRCDA